MYSTRADEEQGLSSLGLAHGADRAEDATDVLRVATENWSPSKADWFLRHKVSYEVRLAPSEVRPVLGRLVVELHNGAPPGGLPDRVIGTNTSEVRYGHNRQLVLLQRAPTDRLVGDVVVDGVPQPVSADFERQLRSYSPSRPSAADRSCGRLLDPHRHAEGWKVDGPTTFDGPLERDVVLEVRLRQTVRALVSEAAVLRPLRLARELLGRPF